MFVYKNNNNEHFNWKHVVYKIPSKAALALRHSSVNTRQPNSEHLLLQYYILLPTKYNTYTILIVSSS